MRGTGFFIKRNEEVFLLTNRHMVDITYSDPKLVGYKIVSFVVDNRKNDEKTGLPTNIIEMGYCKL